jgi:hypothetical protein
MSGDSFAKHLSQPAPPDSARLRWMKRLWIVNCVALAATFVLFPILSQFWNQWFIVAAFGVLSFAAPSLAYYILKRTLIEYFQARAEISE